MKNLLILAFILIGTVVTAQQKSDSLTHATKTTLDSLNQLPSNQLEALKDSININIDSLNFPINQSKLDSLQNLPSNQLDPLNKKLSTKSDSLQSAINKLNPTDSIQQKLSGIKDSLNQTINTPVQKVNRLTDKITNAPQRLLNSKLDSLKNTDKELLNLDSAQLATQSKIDSLQNLQLPHEKYVKKLDSLQNTYTQKVNEKIASIEQKANDKINSIKNKITGNIDGVDDLGIDTPNLPRVDGLDVPNTDVDLDLLNADSDLTLANQPGIALPKKDIGTGTPDLNTNLETNPDLDLDTNLGLKDKLNTDALNSAKEKLNVDEYTSKLADIKAKPKDEINKVKEIGEVKDVTDQLGKVKELGGELEGYQEEIAKIKEGDYEDLERRAAEQAKNFKEIDALDQQSKEFDKLKQEQEDYKQQMEQYQDTAFVIGKAKEVAYEAAVEHFAEHQGVLKSTQTKLLAYKGKYTSLPSIKNIPKRKPNPYEGKALKQRLAPGIQIEVQRANYTGIDLAPFIGYKFNSRLTVYGGYLYRFTFDRDERSFVFGENTRTYGPRVFANYQVFKGFFATLSFDRIRTNISGSGKILESNSQWVNGGFIGIGKQYQFAKKINGSIQGLFNFLHDDQSPYQKKFNIRMALELEWRQKAKSRRKTPPSW
ncbi:MAG: hypothetical protein AAFN93_06225 [Bacteroidota bacterium]